MKRGSGLLIAIGVFLLAVWTNGLLVGLAHDEGVTIDLSAGQIDASLVEDFRPVPLAELQACVDGSAPWTAGDVIRELSRWDNPYPPAYFLVMRAWTALLGVERVTLRLPSVLFGLAALLGLARLARRLVPLPGAGAWAALLIGLSPWFSAISTFARPYALVLAVGVWSTVVALRIARGGARAGPCIAFVLLSLLGIHGLYHYGFVIAWQVLFLAAAMLRGAPGRAGLEAGRPALVRGGVSLGLMCLVIGVGFLPWATRLPAHLALTGSVPSYYLGAVSDGLGSNTLRLLWTLFLGEGLGGPWRFGIVVAFLVLGGLTLLLFALRSRPTARGSADTTPRIFWTTAPLYPLLILVGDLLHGTRTLTISKTSFMLLPLLVLLVLTAWSRVSRPSLRRAGLLAWALLLGTATTATVLYQRQMVDHHRVVADVLAQDDRPDHVVLFNSMVRGHAIPLLLTLQERGVRELSVVFAPPPRLEQVLTETLDDPRVRRATLLNLYSVYAHDREGFCSREQLDAVAARARARGWRVNRASPALLDPGQGAGPRQHRLDVLSPVR